MSICDSDGKVLLRQRRRGPIAMVVMVTFFYDSNLIGRQNWNSWSGCTSSVFWFIVCGL